MTGTERIERTLPDVLGRILLTTDGTVTPLLEHIVDEPVVTARIEQRFTAPDDRVRTLLEAPPGERLLSRSTDLAGARSGEVYVRARSTAVPGALPDDLRAGLLRGAEPIGAMLRRRRVETFREILAHRLAGEPQDPWAWREYRILVGGAPALLIEETFTAACLRRLPS